MARIKAEKLLKHASRITRNKAHSIMEDLTHDATLAWPLGKVILIKSCGSLFTKRNLRFELLKKLTRQNICCENIVLFNEIYFLEITTVYCLKEMCMLYIAKVEIAHHRTHEY